jgi:putative ABC transport system permease protein
MHINFGGQELLSASSCPPLAQAMIEGIPGVEQATQINPWPLKNLVVKFGDKAFSEKKAFLADSNFFEFFSFKMLEGNVRTALKGPHTIVLTTSAATRYFGNEPAIGKTLTLSINKETYVVTGVAEPAPASSHIQYDMLVSSDSDPWSGGGWGNYNGVYTYFKKNPSTPLQDVELKLKDIVKKNMSPELDLSHLYFCWQD